MIDLATFRRVEAALHGAGFASADIEWSENAGPPADAEDFASEAIFVICNSGMQNKVARGIFDRVMAALKAGQSSSTAFGHKGKTSAIDAIWWARDEAFRAYLQADDKLAFCGDLRWIGPITKYHLAKNFGAQVAKPDVHLQRLADREGATVQGLCERLAGLTGYKVPTVDLLLWRACAEGIINSKTGEVCA